MLKFLWKYIFPACYGLLVYFTIRLLADANSGMRFWERWWVINAIEISCSIVMGYFFVWMFHRLYDYFDRKWHMVFSYRHITRELWYVFIVNLVVQNLFLTPMAALTDDGLQWYDLVNINIIPLFYAFIYYGIKRSSTYLQAYIQHQLQLEKLTNDQLQTELKFLKAQYHPHFLFNALNTIYFQMDEDIGAAKKTMEQFAELLRYQLYDQQDTVPVRQEIQYLQNFIELQKIRSSSKLQLSVEIDAQLQEQQIYPLLFLPLVENAFKYIGGQYRLHIQLQQQSPGIRFRITNSVPASTTATRPGGIGLENLKRRLALLYPGQHLFATHIQEDDFIAELNLTLPA
ncbi:sensor histidine kinase [Chitinophaga nivalis]|uniref:Sensor histidine kinase n=1 Tax=Chitinophaga nivalis TaxID=2991709 RepID=A0ABT3IJC0_9BACT|nr:sensor histidine kinase [Chitinophaga nivalis]MCW3466252.1 sensor histidine kinase [Chitinophaga nivalis]MCW3484057.1 sensor histidine kinase [Chitinophaga nivalis]